MANKREFSAEEIAQIVKRYRDDGVGVDRIAQEMKTCRRRIRACLDAARVPRRPGWGRKLTPAQWLKMREEIAQGQAGDSEIARRFGVSRASVFYQREQVAAEAALERFNQERFVVHLPKPDARDFTARFLGDPLPGRSALDMKRRAS